MTVRIKHSGLILLNTLVFAGIAVLMTTVLITWATGVLQAVRQSVVSEQAFQIAEAGIDYYRWHLAHDPDDFQYGTGGPGPYSHDFEDKDGNIIGQYILDITPPPVGSTLVKIKSTGRIFFDGKNVERSVESHLAIPSWAKYSVAANDVMRFGDGTEVFGPIHSNNGIRFDGLAHNLVTSARVSYDDPDHSGAVEFGVHTHVNPPPGSGVNDNFRSLEAPPNTVQLRPDVFIAGRQFPVPAIDFAGLTSNFSVMKTDSQIGGVYLAPSGGFGYHLVLKTNGTFDVYRVTALQSPPSGCTDSGQDGWGTWSIRTVNGEEFLATYSYPANGVVFVEDNVWVDGQIMNTRLLVASGRFPDNPSTRTSITVNKNILYTYSDGRDVLALMAQNNINVGLVSENILRIDAALIAQNGRVGRYYYRPPSFFSNRCSPYHIRNTITLYGMIGTNQRYGFAYTDGTGYDTRNIIYDANLLYSPPPSFPLTSDQYSTIYWSEVR